MFVNQTSGCCTLCLHFTHLFNTSPTAWYVFIAFLCQKLRSCHIHFLFFNGSLSNFRTTCILQPPDLYKHIQNISSSSFVEALAYDSVWALALGLNMTVNMINNNNTLDCGQSPVPLEQFTYGNSSTSCFIRHSLSRTNFTGVSVSCWI